MQAILTDFKPLMKNNTHEIFNTHGEDNYKFSVTLDSNGSTILGEAWAKSTAGSRSWTIGLMHDYSIKENSYCDNGNKITGLKVSENASATQNSTPNPVFSAPTASIDFSNQAYVISRFSHTIALDYVNSLPDEDLVQLKKDKGDSLISLYAASFANSVYKVADQVMKLHEAGNTKAT